MIFVTALFGRIIFVYLLRYSLQVNINIEQNIKERYSNKSFIY